MSSHNPKSNKISNSSREKEESKSSTKNFITPEKVLKPVQPLNTTKPESQPQTLEGNSNTRLKIQKITKHQENISNNPTAIKEDPKKSLRRKRSIFDKTPLYVPSKRVKKNEKYYQSELKVYDNLRNEYIKFRIFKDSDLGNSKTIQNTLKESTLDDDCPTDTEQLQLAKEYVKKQLFAAHKNNTESKVTPQKEPRSDETTDASDAEDDESDFTSTFYLSHSKSSNSCDTKSVTKRLDFDL